MVEFWQPPRSKHGPAQDSLRTSLGGGGGRIGFRDALLEPQHLSPLAAVGRSTRQCTAHGG